MANSPQSQLEPILAIKTRRSRKPQAIKTAVVLKRANGQPISHIAKELGISHNTTRGIIEESGVDKQLETGQILSASLIPDAVTAVGEALRKKDGNLGLSFLKWQLGENPNSKNGHQQALNAVFSGCQVLIQQATASTLHKNAAEPSTNNEQPIAQVTDSKPYKP